VLALPDDIKISIADIVRHFEFTVQDCGSCVARALIGDATFRTCGLSSRVVAGGMLYRAGHDPMRDTIRFCLMNQMGGYLHGKLVGHVWNEIDAEIADFSSGDWVNESTGCAINDLGDTKYGLVEWHVDATPPPFIWQSARSLKSEWKPHGVPKLGHIWYSGWVGNRLPDYTSHDGVIAKAMPHITAWIKELQLHERIAAFREGLPSLLGVNTAA